MSNQASNLTATRGEPVTNNQTPEIFGDTGSIKTAMNQTTTITQPQVPAIQPYRLALMVRQGLGAKERPQFAFSPAKFAAEQGHPHAKQLLARFYLQGYGVVANPDEAARWL